MVDKDQFKILYRILNRFQQTGILQEMMLIGSWCLHFYRFMFENHEGLPATRTMDVDFLIPDIHQVRAEVDIPKLLKEEGFLSNYNRVSGMVKFDHPDLRVEFLVPELGKGHDKPLEIKKLNIKAQGLRYLNFLTDYPRIITYQHLRIRVPEPAVFALHKLIISGRRLNKEKAKKDLEMAVGLLDFLYTKPSEVGRIKSVLRTIPKKWRETILSVSEKHFPKLNETAKEL